MTCSLCWHHAALIAAPARTSSQYTMGLMLSSSSALVVHQSSWVLRRPSSQVVAAPSVSCCHGTLKCAACVYVQLVSSSRHRLWSPYERADPCLPLKPPQPFVLFPRRALDARRYPALHHTASFHADHVASLLAPHFTTLLRNDAQGFRVEPFCTSDDVPDSLPQRQRGGRAFSQA